MRKIRRTIVSVEIEQVLLAKTSGPLPLHCPACDGPATMLTPEQAGVLVGLGLRPISRLIETGELHSTESPTGTWLVCANSLANYCLKPQPGS